MSDSGARRLTVNEYKGKRLIEEWDSLTECAKFHGVKQATIKELIHYGDSRRGHTFDIPATSCYDTRQNPETGALEIFDTKTGEVLDGGASRRKKKEGANEDLQRLRRSSKSIGIKEGNQQASQRSFPTKRQETDKNREAVG